MTRSVYLQYTCLKNTEHCTVSWPVEKTEGKSTITVEKGKKKKPLFTDDMFMHAESLKTLLKK